MDKTVRKSAVPSVLAPITLATKLMDHVHLDALMVIKENCVILVRIVSAKNNNSLLVKYKYVI